MYDELYYAERPDLGSDARNGHFYNYALWLCKTFEFDTVLDVGCGFGFLLNHLHNLGKKVQGVEVSRFMIEDTLKRYPHLQGKLVLDSLPDLDNLPYTSGAYDLVVSTQVIEHLTYVEALSAIKRMYALAGKYTILDICTDVGSGKKDATHKLVKAHDWWVRILTKHPFRFTLTGFSYCQSPDEFILVGKGV